MDKTNKYVEQNVGIYLPGPRKTRMEACMTFLYNSEEGSCLGRTASSWAKILTFYVIYYACLAGFWAVCMWALMQTIDSEVPKYLLDSSLIGSSPGLAFRPMPPERREFGLTYNRNNNEWTSNTEFGSAFGEFLKEYESLHESAVECNYTSERVNDSVPCAVDTNGWGDCKSNGTKISSPCIYFKLNKVYNWVTEYYKDLSSLPEHIPTQLKNAISQTLLDNPVAIRKVWLSCVGRNEEDETKLGEVTYYPEQGFPAYFYPFHRQEEFLSPVVAVKFGNADVDTEINIECRTWAPNMVQDRKEQLGVLNFKIKIE